MHPAVIFCKRNSENRARLRCRYSIKYTSKVFVCYQLCEAAGSDAKMVTRQWKQVELFFLNAKSCVVRIVGLSLVLKASKVLAVIKWCWMCDVCQVTLKQNKDQNPAQFGNRWNLYAIQHQQSPSMVGLHCHQSSAESINLWLFFFTVQPQNQMSCFNMKWAPTGRSNFPMAHRLLVTIVILSRPNTVIQINWLIFLACKSLVIRPSVELCQ